MTEQDGLPKRTWEKVIDLILLVTVHRSGCYEISEENTQKMQKILSP